MTYRLYKLAPGSYDVILNGVIVASLVRATAYRRTWMAELLCEPAAGEMPAPFTQTEHESETLEEVREWLGGAPIFGEGPGGPARG